MSGSVSFRLFAYDLPLRREWTVSSGSVARRQGWIVACTCDGRTGFGDCPADAPGHAALGSDRAALEAGIARLAGLDADEALAALTGAGGAAAALECAVLDARARRDGRELRLVLDPASRPDVPVNAATTGNDLAAVAAQGFTVAKVKVGWRPPAEDLAWLGGLAIPEGLRLRLDANRAWSGDQARAFLDGIAALPVESLEEPLAAPTLEGLAALQAHTAIDLAVDESLPMFGGEAVVAARPVRRLVVKLGAVGGLRGTLALARRARAAGMVPVVTSRLDSAIGVAAAGHLAAAVAAGGPDGVAHGLATSAWLARDVCPPLTVARGRFCFNGRPGLGIDYP